MPTAAWQLTHAKQKLKNSWYYFLRMHEEYFKYDNIYTSIHNLVGWSPCSPQVKFEAGDNVKYVNIL